VIGNFGNGETMGLKLWYFHNQSDGFYHNATYNRPDGGSKDSFGGTILFKPADSDFTAQFTIENVIQSFTPAVSNLAKTGEVFCALNRRRNATATPPPIFTPRLASRRSAIITRPMPRWK
jgi:hypothetical protein